MKKERRNYHPLLIILFASGMLPNEALNKLPRTTKHNWKHFEHDNYNGSEWVESYIKQFDNIKDVFQSKFTARVIKTILKTRRRYYKMHGEIKHNKNLLKLHADSIVVSVEDMARFFGVTVHRAGKFYGISKDWYYIQKRKLICPTSLL